MAEPGLKALEEFLEERGYSKHVEQADPYAEVKILFQRRVPDDWLDHACQTNDKNFFNVQYVRLREDPSIPKEGLEMVEAGMRAECHTWWRIGTYGLSVQELIDKLPWIEGSLVDMWNTLEE